MIPDDLLYTDQHEWIRQEGKTVTVGITDFAQDSLGDITFVELPEVGKTLAGGDEACTLESAKAASNVYAPAAGEITAVNEALEDNPAAINDAPYGDGWMFKLQLTDPSELEKLLSPDEYKQLLVG